MIEPIKGTGPEGRIVKEDIKSICTVKKLGTTATAAAAYVPASSIVPER